MSRVPRIRHTQCGFTLIELLIAMAISGVVLGAISTIFISQRSTYALQEQVTEMTQNARAAMEALMREIRMAGFNANGAFNGITYHATQLRILSDFDEDGFTTGVDEDVTFSHDAVNYQLTRDVGGGGQPMADRIETFTFQYLDGAGNPTTSSALIRQLQITIVARTTKPDARYPRNGGYRTYTLMTVVTPRNL